MIWVTITFYITCALCSVCHVPYEIAICYPQAMGGSWVSTSIRALDHFTYGSHWVAMLSIYFLRLKMCSDGTAFPLHKWHQHLFLAAMALIVMLSVLIVVALVLQPVPLIISCLAAAVLIGILAVYSQVLIYMFVRRLYIINTMSRIDDQLVSIMVQQSILVVVCFISSTLIITGVIFSGLTFYYGPREEWIALALSNALPIDLLVDIVCVSLGLPIFKPIYQFLCGALDRRLKKCCIGTALRKTNDLNDKAMELQISSNVACSIQSEQQNAGDIVEHETVGWISNDKALADKAKFQE